MSLEKNVQSPRGQRVLAFIRSLSVAAICALGIWHGYLFRVEHAAPAKVEWTLRDAGGATPKTNNRMEP